MAVNHKSLVIVAALAVAAAGCAPEKITKEQLDQLRELRKQQTALQDKIRLSQGDIARLEAEIADRQKVADKCKEEKSAVEQRLAQWPNIWPDAVPAAQDSAKSPKKAK